MILNVQHSKLTGFVPTAMTPAQFGTFIADETAKWAKVVKFAGVKLD